MTSLPSLQVTVYSDYICPFCYVGHHRLDRLRDTYDLKINWCFLEIHPETLSTGEPVSTLEYTTEQWNQLMTNLRRVADEEGIPLTDISFITSSRQALLLAEAAKQCGSYIFYRLHKALFEAYFVEEKNIGDEAILREIASMCHMDEDIVDSAWMDNQYQQRLLDNYTTARQHGIQSVPSFIFGKRVLTGVVAESVFREAAKELYESTSNPSPG